MKIIGKKRIWISIGVAVLILAISAVTLARTGNFKFLADTLNFTGSVRVTPTSPNGGTIQTSILTMVSATEFTRITPDMNIISGETGTFEDMPYADYKIVMKQGECSASVDLTVSAANPNPTVVQTLTCLPSYGAIDVTATSPNGGAIDVDLELSDGSFFMSQTADSGTKKTFENVPYNYGSKYYTVRMTQGTCSATETVTINSTNPLATVVKTLTCDGNGGNTGGTGDNGGNTTVVCDLTNWKVGDVYPTGCITLGLKNDKTTNLPKIKGWLCLKGAIRDFASTNAIYSGNVSIDLEWNNVHLAHAQYDSANGKFTFVNVPIFDGVNVADLKVKFTADDRDTQTINASDLIGAKLDDNSLKKASCTVSNDYCLAECYSAASNVTLSKSQNYTVSGRVVDNTTGASIQGAQVSSAANFFTAATTDSNGYFTLNFTASTSAFNNIKINFKADGYDDLEKTMSELGASASSTVIDLKSKPVKMTKKVVEVEKASFTVLGTVRANGENGLTGLSGTMIEAINSKSETVEKATSGSDGTYRIQFSTPASDSRDYTIRATLPAGYKFSDNTKTSNRSVTFPAGLTPQLFNIDFESQIIQLRIKAIDAKTGVAPTQETKITIYDPYCKVNGRSELNETFTAKTLDNGDKVAYITGTSAEYLYKMVSGCNPKNGSIYGIAVGYSKDASPIESIYHTGINLNSEIPVLYLYPEDPTGTKTVTVVDENGDPLIGAEVAVSPAEFGLSFLKKTTDSSGNIAFTNAELSSINKTYASDLVFVATKDDYYAENNSNTAKIKDFKNSSYHTKLVLWNIGFIPYSIELQVHVFDYKTKSSLSENAEVTVENSKTKIYAFLLSNQYMSSNDVDNGFRFYNYVANESTCRNSNDKNNTRTKSGATFSSLCMGQTYNITVRSTAGENAVTKTIQYTIPTKTKKELKLWPDIVEKINVYIDSGFETVSSVPLQIVNSNNQAVKDVAVRVSFDSSRMPLHYDGTFPSESVPCDSVKTIYSGKLLSITKSFMSTSTCSLLSTKQFKNGESIYISTTDTKSPARYNDYTATKKVKVDLVKNKAETIKIVLQNVKTQKQKGIRVRKVSNSSVFGDPETVDYTLEKENSGVWESADYKKDLSDLSDGEGDIYFYPDNAGKYRVKATNTSDNETEENYTGAIDFDPTTAAADVDLTFAKKVTVCSQDSGQYLREYAAINDTDYYILFPSKTSSDESGDNFIPIIQQLADTEKILTGKNVSTLFIVDSSNIFPAGSKNSDCDSTDLGAGDNKWQRVVNIPISKLTEDADINSLNFFARTLYSELLVSSDPVSKQIASDFAKEWSVISSDSNLGIAVMSGEVSITSANQLFAIFISRMINYPTEFENSINSTSNTELRNILRYLFEKIYIAYGFPAKTNYNSEVRDKNNFVLTDYSADMIKKGAAFQNTYDVMSATDKVYANYLELTNTMRKTGKVVVEQLNAIYSKLDEVVNDLYSNYYLSKVGTNFGSVNGKVVDKKGKPVANVVVKVGERYRITDSNGTFTTSNLPVGNQPIYVETFADRVPIAIKSPAKNAKLKAPAVNIIAKKTANLTIKLDYTVSK